MITLSKKRILISAIMSVMVLTAIADEYKDPATNVIYTYDPTGNTAEVKMGYWDMYDDGSNNPPSPGSPNAKEELVILDRFSVDGKEYVVDKISDYALCCLNIKSVVIPSSVKSIGWYAFYGCHELSNLVLSEGIKSIGMLAFSNCHSMTSFSLPEGLEEIGFEAFACNPAQESISIPSTVTKIEPLVFFCCDALTEVTSMIENPFKVENLCGYSPQVQTTLRVPYGTKSKYEETSGWNQFYRIEELNSVTNYLSFVEEGKVWHYEVSNPNAGSEHYSEWLTDYMLEGDTIIGNYNCKKLYVTSDCPFNKRERLYSGALFEKDSLVYHIYPNGTEPYLLYDFTPQKGDDVSIGGISLTIRDRQNIPYNGKPWLVLTWSPKDFDIYKSLLIEGIGCPDSEILNYYDSWTPGAYRYKLLSCEVNGKEIFSTNTFPLINGPVTFTAGQMATIVLPTAPDASKGM